MGPRGAVVDHLAAGKIWYAVNYISSRYILNLLLVTSIAGILRAYNRSLEQHAEFAERLRPHSISFEESREIVHQWAKEHFLEEEGWDAKWEDLCLAEIDKWITR